MVTPTAQVPGTDGGPAAAELTAVSKSFTLESGDRVDAAINQTLRIEAGEFVCVIGPSGHGKSTLLNMIAGFTLPTCGLVSVNGQPVTGPGPDRGVVFQRDTLFLWKRVYENIEFGLKARGIPKGERQTQVNELLRVTGLEGFAKAWPKQLSGGMRRRVAIAAVLANRPAVLLMDEPFAGLDYFRLSQMHTFLLDVWMETGGQAIVMVTHDVEEAIALADRIVFVKQGKIELDCRVDIPRPRHARGLTGDRANEIRKTIIEKFEE